MVSKETRETLTIGDAIHKLTWGAKQSDWSVQLTPIECAAVLALIAKKPKARKK